MSKDVTFGDLLSEIVIEAIRAREQSVEPGQNSSRFTSEMADFERQIRHELLIYNNDPRHGHTSSSTF